jgi:N-acetylneuraminic acid mutarotase
MSRHLPYAIGLTVGALGFAACDEEPTTQPSRPADPSLAPPSLAAASNGWSPIAPMPLQAGQGPAIGVVPSSVGRSKAYVFGGTDGEGGSGAATRVYDVAANTWRVISNATPTRVFAFNLNGVGNVRDKLYFSGGKDYGSGTLTFTNAVWEFDPVTETLSRKADMPLFTADGVTGVIGDRLYVLPGSCSGDRYPNPGFCAQEPIRKLFRYNPATDIWVTRASAPHFHKSGVGGVINDKLFVAGGQDDHLNPTRNLDVYDPATNTWKTLAPLPAALNSVVGAVLQGQLFVIGTNSVGSIRHYAYNPASNKWNAKAVPSHYGGPAAKVFLNGSSRLLVLEGGTVDIPDRSQLYTP